MQEYITHNRNLYVERCVPGAGSPCWQEDSWTHLSKAPISPACSIAKCLELYTQKSARIQGGSKKGLRFSLPGEYVDDVDNDSRVDVYGIDYYGRAPPPPQLKTQACVPCFRIVASWREQTWITPSPTSAPLAD